ncbi:MAG: 4Fe-4S binding protein [Phycisphaeraceae bacterium]
MRLNWFLPFLRVSKKGPPRKSPGLVVRLFSIIIPKRYQSNTISGKPGPLRKLLKKISPAWSASPLRKLSQTAFFILFLVLFFYVCWPYSAKPAQVWTGWQPLEVDPDSGVTSLINELPPPASLAVGRVVYLADPTYEPPPGASEEERASSLGAFVVQSIEEKTIRLKPREKLTPQQAEAIAFAAGKLTLHEKPPGAWPVHYAEERDRKEKIAAEAILIIDPLVSLSTGLASRAWVWSLVAAGVILIICVFIPRGFCGYICPLGTLIDLFDWAIGKRVTRFRAPDDGWWVHIKYYVLLGTLIAAMFGVLISGFVSAIPVLTRGLLFIFHPLQTGAHRGWHNVPSIHIGHFVSLILFAAVLVMGFWKPRFWCKYVCPSGAVFSVFNHFRATERKVESTCINCNKCVEICPFDAIKPDFTTRVTDCTLCQTCGGACPVDAIKFVDRGNRVELKVLNDPPTHETAIGRRGFLAAGVGIAAAGIGGTAVALTIKGGARLDDPTAWRPVRPPGSVPEQEFLQMCIRCGECFKACPNDVLQPLGFEQGMEGLWSPHVVADFAGCEVSCNNCGQVCPTGAIRALSMPEKKAARMGLAIVNESTCLPYAGREACQLCVDECVAAGYDAIEFIRTGTRVDEQGNPIEGTGFISPIVREDKCVGCGLCQTRCFAINVAEKKLLDESAIIIKAGAGREDRMMTGSYVLQRKREAAAREEEMKKRFSN